MITNVTMWLFSQDEEDSNPGNNLFITGLAARTADRDLEEVFSKYGKVSHCNVLFICY